MWCSQKENADIGMENITIKDSRARNETKVCIEKSYSITKDSKWDSNEK